MAIQSEGNATVLDVLVPVVIARGEEMVCGAYIFDVTPESLSRFLHWPPSHSPSGSTQPS